MDPASIAFAALAEEYRRAGRFEEAIAACLSGLKRHPSYLSARMTLGCALIEAGRYEEAEEEIEVVLRMAPENLAATRALAEIRQRREAASSPPAASARHDPQVTALQTFLAAIQSARTAGKSRPH
jgi:tetratricopeptide (TPR) repeat protein